MEFLKIEEGVVPPNISPTAIYIPRVGLLAELTFLSRSAWEVMDPGKNMSAVGSSKY